MKREQMVNGHLISVEAVGENTYEITVDGQVIETIQATMDPDAPEIRGRTLPDGAVLFDVARPGSDRTAYMLTKDGGKTWDEISEAEAMALAG